MNDDDPWAEYARIQALAASSRISDRTWAAEEALYAILDKIESREALSAQQSDNLVTNRARKQRERRKLLALHACHLYADAANENDRLEARSDLAWHQGRCSRREWRVLVSAAIGHNYVSIADAENTSEATVKTWVRRARLKLAA